MKTNQTSPSGVRSRISATVKSIPLSHIRGKNLNYFGLRAMLVMLLCVLGIGEMWAVPQNGYGILHLTSEATAKGLVYANKDNVAPSSDESYAPSSDSEAAKVCNSEGSEPRDFYGWAKGARGWQWASWEVGATVPNPTYDNAHETKGTCKIKTNAAAGVFTLNGGRDSSSEHLVTAKWKEDGSATITFAQTIGGSYNVNYQYVKVNTSNKFTPISKNYTISPTSGDVRPSETAWDGTTDNRSYVNDVITLSTTASNLIRWEEVNAANGAVTNLTPTVSGTTRSYDYKVTDGKTATIRAVFKSAVLGEIGGDKQISVNNLTKEYGYSLTVPVTDISGDWVVGDFTVDFENKNGAATFTPGSVQYSADLLTIPFTYKANSEGNTTIDVVVSTPYGAETSCQIVATAELKVDYEAQILLEGQTDPTEDNTGTLAAMLTKANGMSGDFKLMLMNPVTITEPLSFTNSFTFDINGKTITSSGNAAISIDVAGIDVRIVDGSFIKAGRITTEKSYNGIISAVRYTAAGKITMEGSTIIANNTSTAAGAKAYAVNVANGSVFYMTAGSYGRVSAEAKNEAVAIYVATTSDYATMNGGVVEAFAETNAYGLWSAGQSNVTNATISAETTTGANAYGAYINGGVATLTTNTIAITAATAKAYGAYVNTGRLNLNGGTVTVNANSDVYGVHIAAGATASVLMRAEITANATTAGNARGLNNIGTLIANNAIVRATAATTGAMAVNSETSAVSTSIDGGSYVATAGNGTVYGLHHQYGDLSVDGGEFHGIATGGSIAYGARTTANGTIKNATLWGETQGVAHTAYGYVAGMAGKNTTLTKCVIKGESATATAYAIYSRAIVEATDCDLTATANNGNRAAAFWAENGTNTITRCNGSVMASEAEVWGVNHLAGACTINGGSYTVLAKQAKASTTGDTKAYGVQNAVSLTTHISDATFSVTGNNTTYAQNVYGLYASGTANCKNSMFDAKSRIKAFGVYGDGSSNLVLNNNSITSTATNGTTSYGIYAKKDFKINGDIVSAVGSETGVYAMFFDASTSVGEVEAGKFSAQTNANNDYGALNADGTVEKVKLKGGIYKTKINLEKYAYAGYQVYLLDGTHPDYADGYRYTIASESPSQYVCRIVGGAYYATLEAALQYTLDNSGNYTIVMTQNYTLPAGDYTLPSNATLVVPYQFDQTSITVQTPSNPGVPDKRTTAGLREAFLCLTMANGAHLNVNGKIGVGGEMYCVESGRTSYNNSPYGRIHMEEGSIIQLNGGARLYAWGFITGSGAITVKNNAEVHEMFQVGDMKAAGNIYDGYYNNDYDFFLFNQYCIQNIEVPTTYYYNSQLIVSMRCYQPGHKFWYGEDNIKIVGTSGALFNVTTDDESTWVRKSYDATHDYQVWDINSKAQLGSISVTLDLSSIFPIGGKLSFNSFDYILPVTSNMKIHILDGDFEITENTELLPGSSIEINKTASLTINEGKKLYVFDKDQWPSSLGTASCTPVYSLGWPNGTKPSRTAGDAAINVHGNINVLGALYTSNKGTETSKTDGANIYSNNADAGTVSYSATAPSATTITLMTSASATKKVEIESAKLKNGNGSFTSTSGTAKDHSFAYMNDAWTQTYTNGCFEVIDTKVYAKPSGYVQLKKTQEGDGLLQGVEESDHTYITIDDKLLIIYGDCQWWEVEATSDLTVFECKKEGYEGFYYYDDYSQSWQLKTVRVTFYSTEEGEGGNVLHTIVTDFNGRPDQSVIPSNPKKDTDTGYTYQFYGWKSSATGTTYKWTDQLEVATADMSYRPVFTATKRNYTITLIDAKNGATVPVEVPYGEVPSYEAKKDPTAQYTYTFDHWDPELQPVSGPATYTAIWSSVVNRYTITWMDGETVLETDKHQPYGTATSFGGTLPTKETDDNFVYTFNGWKSSLTGTTYANGSTPAVEGETTYSAQYNTTPRYMISFINYDGSPLQKEAFTQGVNPVYKGETPGRKRDFDGYYSFTGWKNSDGTFYAANATLPAVTAKETYTAQYTYVTDLFEITLKNVDGAGATWSGYFGEGSTPFYDPDNDDVADKPTKTGNAQYSYPFTGWTPALEPVSEAGQRTYTAQFGEEINSYTITFANVDGNGAQRTADVEYGQTPVCPVTPEKVDGVNSYAFTGWNKSIVPVVGEETYTATFSSTPTVRQFDITFDLDNDSPVTIVPVTYGTTPEWTGETPTKPATAQYTYTFAGWYPEFAPVTGEETYTAQYTQTLNSYTIRFVNYDGTELQSSDLAYGALPTYSGSAPQKPADLVNMKAYNFSGWSPAIATVTGAATYTAQYNEVDLVASVTTASNETSYYGSWSSALSAANSSANCTLRLYQNVTAPVLTKINQNMTIDLNGCTLSCTTSSTTDNRFIWVNQVALIIDDSKGGGKIYFEGTGNKNYNAIRVDGVGSLTVRGGTIQAHATSNNNSSAAYAVLLYNNSTTQGSTLNIYGGELIASHTQNARTASTVYFNGTNYVNVYGGKLKGKNSIFNNNNTANRIVLRGGYYSLDPGTTLTIATGYQKVATTELTGYTHKVTPAEYTITFNKGTRGNANQSATVDFAATELKTFTPVTAAGYDCTGYFDGNTKVLNADGTFAAETVSGYITDGKWSKAANCPLTAQWSLSSTLEANDQDNIPVAETAEVEKTIIHAGGIVAVETGVTLTTTDLILEATSNSSGQLVADGAGNINVTGNVYFDLYLDTDARHWHAYGVPWQVDVNANPLIELETGRTLVVGRDCEIVYYNGETRATQGAGSHCWEYLKHYSGNGSVDVMMPGKGYMIAFTSHVGTVRFTKAAGAPIIYSGKVNLAANNGGATEDNGWNAMANPMAYHATMKDGPTVGYVHDGGEIGSDGYTKYDLSHKKFIVGKMVYVQSDGDEVTPTYADGDVDPIVAATPAPARRKAATNKKYLALSDYYRVSIENTAGVQGGDVCVLPEDDKAETYVIGHDLSQFGMNATKPQLWINRYGTQLALNTTAPVNGVADFPMSVYAPAAGEYTIALAAQPDEEYAVYLTKDGEVIWNLSDGACTLTLTKGTAADYGLRLGEKKAPEVATGFGEAVVDAHGKTTKVLIDGKVFIIREDRVYSIDGQLVK